MEPITAAWVVGLLAVHAKSLVGPAIETAAKEGGEFLAGRVKALVAAVRAHFRDDPAATDALDRLDQAPDDARRQGAVEERVEEALAADPSFVAALQQLADEIRAAGPQSVTVQDAGAVAVNGNVTLTAGGHAAGRDLIIGSPERDPT
jgi:hypothetical protein